MWLLEIGLLLDTDCFLSRVPHWGIWVTQRIPKHMRDGLCKGNDGMQEEKVSVSWSCQAHSSGGIKLNASEASIRCPVKTLFPTMYICLALKMSLDIGCLVLKPWQLLILTLNQLEAVLSHFSHVQLFVTLWTVACQTPLSMGFSRQVY